MLANSNIIGMCITLYYCGQNIDVQRYVPFLCRNSLCFALLSSAKKLLMLTGSPSNASNSEFTMQLSDFHQALHFKSARFWIYLYFWEGEYTLVFRKQAISRVQ